MGHVNDMPAPTCRRRGLPPALLLVAVATLNACDGTMGPTPVPQSGAPQITCPAPVTVTSSNGSALNVTYTPATVAGGKAPTTLACTPVSNSSFALGDTTVTCTATDALQRRASCSFRVSVVAPPKIALTSFAAFGDSITAGDDGTHFAALVPPASLPLVLASGNYPDVLIGLLRAKYTAQVSQLQVANLGAPGEFAAGPETMSRFNQKVIASDAQALLLMEGANDITFWDYNNQPSVAASQTAAISALGAMIDRARQRGIRVYLATLPPQRPNPPAMNCSPICRGYGAPYVAEFNDRIRVLAVQKNATLVDVNAAFGGDLSLINGDGLHPNLAGFQRIAEAFMLKLSDTIGFAPVVPLRQPSQSSVGR
jgi:lysophospholipase L1-like esterase